MHKNITALTRRNMLNEVLHLGNIQGKLELTDFIALTWPIDNMSSTDSRFETARIDIIVHAENFSDWDLDYLYWEYLDIENCEDEILMKFLEASTHPIVRINLEEQELYVEVINSHIKRDGFQLEVKNYLSGYPIYSVIRIKGGVQGNIKNLIFAADGYKPEIVLRDSVNNEIEIIKNQEYCLVYDREISTKGLSWEELVNWWKETQMISGTDVEASRDLYKRLYKSLSSTPEKEFFKVYFEMMLPLLDKKMPAIIPQVYLHYDPYTLKELKGIRRVARERMDFLLLLNNSERIVIEIDGKHHYANSTGEANVHKYATMVREDRELKLKGYEVYRFGGGEFNLKDNAKVYEGFLRRLFIKHHYLKE